MYQNQNDSPYYVNDATDNTGYTDLSFNDVVAPNETPEYLSMGHINMEKKTQGGPAWIKKVTPHKRKLLLIGGVIGAISIIIIVALALYFTLGKEDDRPLSSGEFEKFRLYLI